MSKLFLDLESIPTDRQDVLDLIASKVTPPGNISKPETIAKWMEESKPAAVEEAIAKTSLDGAFGRVCVIGWAIDDGTPMSIRSEGDEELLLRLFADEVKRINPFDCCVIGHNVSAFDLRFLVQRYIVNGIKPPAVITRAAQAKPWESEKVFDSMVQWAGIGNRISLEKLCMALSIASPKTDLDGSKVAQWVADGRIAEVASYCEGDVDAVRKVWKRMTFQEHVLSAATEVVA